MSGTMNEKKGERTVIHHYQIRLSPIRDHGEIGYEAEVLDFLTCTTSGDSVDEALENVVDAMQEIILAQKILNLPLPIGYKPGDKLREECTLLVAMDEEGHVVRYFEPEVDDENFLQVIVPSGLGAIAYRYNGDWSRDYCEGFQAGVDYVMGMIDKRATFEVPTKEME